MKSQKLSGIYARWALRLHEYDFEIVFRPGIANGNADCVSRFPQPSDGADWEVFREEMDYYAAPAASQPAAASARAAAVAVAAASSLPGAAASSVTVAATASGQAVSSAAEVACVLALNATPEAPQDSVDAATRHRTLVALRTSGRTPRRSTSFASAPS
jgi:hypothetical protein